MHLYIFDIGEVLLMKIRTIRQIAEYYHLDYRKLREDYFLYEKPLMEGYLAPWDYYHHLEVKFGISFHSDPFKRFFSPELNRNVLSFASALKKRGERIVIGSNTFSPHWEIIFQRYREIPLLFDELYASHEIHRVKPDVCFFEYILEREGFESGDSFFIDDRKENIDGSSSLGITSYEYHGDDEELEVFLQL